MVDEQGVKYSGNRENHQELEGPLSFKVGKSESLKVGVQTSTRLNLTNLFGGERSESKARLSTAKGFYGPLPQLVVISLADIQI
jgi:hypothetical protein